MKRKQENKDISVNDSVLTVENDIVDTGSECNEEVFERCVMCGALTAVPITMPIEWREDYEPGIGQICIECSMKMRKVSENENNVMHAQIIKSIGNIKEGE